jgi:hypothetical protein
VSDPPGHAASAPPEAPALAVLTGDIVRSSALPPGSLDAAMQALAAAADAAAAWRGTPSLFTRFRGDGWQCLAPEPALALRAALFLRAAIRRLGRDFDTRISVGFGSGDVPAAGLAAADGTAFRAAGNGLDMMARQVRLRATWSEPPPAAAHLAAIYTLCDAISRRWTPAQATVLADMLVPEAPTQAAIAAKAGVSQQMVAKHLGASGEWAVQDALAAVEDAWPR